MRTRPNRNVYEGVELAGLSRGGGARAYTMAVPRQFNEALACPVGLTRMCTLGNREKDDG